MQLTISTFNIRTASVDDGVNVWEQRKALVLQSIREHEPDIIGFQEVLPSVKRFFRQTLPDKTLIGENRAADFTGESTPLAYQTKRFELVDADTFWLSPTPYQAGSQFPNSDTYPRICTALTLRVMDTTHMLRVFNTHLDYRFENIRRKQIGVLAEQVHRLQSKRKLPFILTGDFNTTPGSASLQTLLTDFPISLTDAVSIDRIGTDITYHGYFVDSERVKIDYILVSDDFHILSACADTRHSGPVYTSDHYPLYATLAF
ncbi:MAG: endonuclease/exonuclease/phosphatase family protein [Ethanoligenens sp.]